MQYYERESFETSCCMRCILFNKFLIFVWEKPLILFIIYYILARKNLSFQISKYTFFRKPFIKMQNLLAADGVLDVVKGPKESPHSHPPNQEASAAEVIRTQTKQKAVEHLKWSLAQLLRTELQKISKAVLSQLPKQPAIVRTIRRARQSNLGRCQ